MNHYELLRFPDAQELAKAVAQAWLTELSTSHVSRRLAAPKSDEGGSQTKAELSTPCTALSGGRIARQFFSETAALAKNRNLPLGSIHFLWADERCVPPTDPE